MSRTLVGAQPAAILDALRLYNNCAISRRRTWLLIVDHRCLVLDVTALTQTSPPHSRSSSRTSRRSRSRPRTERTRMDTFAMDLRPSCPNRSHPRATLKFCRRKRPLHPAQRVPWLQQRNPTPRVHIAHEEHLYRGELGEKSVAEESSVTDADGKKYLTKLYSLDAILAVGYRVRSPRGVQFRRWASTILKEYLIKGFVMDDERLKNPDGLAPHGGWDRSRRPLLNVRG